MTTTPPSSDRDWRRWLRLWTLLSVPGLGLGLLMWGVQVVIGVALLPMLVGGAVQAMALSATRETVTARQMVTACVRASGAAAVVTVAVSALGVLTPLAGVGVVALLVVTSPLLAERVLRLVRGRASGRAPEPVPDRQRPAADVRLLSRPAGQLSGPQLCRAWRQSFAALEATRSPTERARLVTLRQSYLDELEQRDALALRAWLATDATAARGPDRHLSPDEGRPDAA